MLGTKQGELAIKAPEFKKIETEVHGGLARAVARIEVIEVPLVMAYNLAGVPLKPGDSILLRGDAGLNKWVNASYRLQDGTMFVLCPESAVIGYRSK
jgi:hypothetical protein